MAKNIDFTNATIKVPTENAYGPINAVDLGLNNQPHDQNWNRFGRCTRKIISDKRREYNYMGAVGCNGTKIYIAVQSDMRTWEIGNISYETGDTYSFTVAVELP